MLQPVLVLLAALGAAFLAVLALAYAGQSRMMFHPTRELAATPADLGMAFERVALNTADGVRLEAWWLPPERPDDRVVLFFHGNAGNLSHRLETLRFLSERGLGVLILSYRGYGPSEGRPSELGLYHDADAAWSHLRDGLGIPPERIVLFGRSMGAAVAAYLAERHRPAALVLESAFTSVPDLARDLYPWLPTRRMVRLRFPTLERVSTLDIPVLILHSTEDEIVPFRHAERLAAAAPDAELAQLRGSHNLSVVASGALYDRAWDRFLARLGAADE